MALPNTVSFQSPGFDYSADIGAIERQRKLAEALQAQSMEAIPQQTAGGWVLRTSPLQGLGKMAQAWAGTQQNKAADQRQRDLSTRAQTDLSRVLSEGATAATGRPAMTIQPDQQEAQQSADFGSPQVSPVNSPAIAPDPMKAASLYMSHPMTSALGSQMMGQEIASQRLQRALQGAGVGGQQNGAAPQGASQGGGTPQGGQPTQQPNGSPGGLGGPAGGQPMAWWLAVDPTGAKYTEQLAKDQVPIASREGDVIRQRPDGTYGSVYQQPKMEPGMLPQRNAQGQVTGAAPIPGYQSGISALKGAEAGAVTSAQEAAKSPNEIVHLPNPNDPSSTISMTRAQAIELMGGKKPTSYGQAPNETAAIAAINAGGRQPQSIEVQSAPEKKVFRTPTAEEKAIQSAAQKFGEGSAEQAVKYRTALNEHVAMGQDLLSRLTESRNALSEFQAGGGKESRLKVAQAAQAMGLPDSVVNGIAGGNIAAMQEFQKLSIQQAMESLRQAMATAQGTGAGRITQAEFQIFLQANPSLSLDPRAIDKIYTFTERMQKRDFEEQQGFANWLKDGKNPAEFAPVWAAEQQRKLTNPNSIREIVQSGRRATDATHRRAPDAPNVGWKDI